MPTYRNKTDQDLTLPNIGVVEAHKTIESETPIENSNFELVSGSVASQTPNTFQGTEKKAEESK